MAPTEVLAEQHHDTMVSLLGDLSVPDEARLGGERPLRVELLSGSRGAAERRRAAQGLAAGDVDIVVGTHALISEGLEYRALGVVVIDEQHRFGVEQRAVLRDRGPGSVLPDLLVMTATPIPRTAAMTVYGDLDVSVLDELPAGPIAGGHILGTRAAGGDPSLGGGAGRCLRGSPGLCRVPGHRGVGRARRSLRHRDARAPDRRWRRAHRPAGRPPARPGDAGREGGDDGAVPVRPAGGAGGHDRHRSRGGRAQRNRHGRCRRGPVRYRPTPPTPGPGGPLRSGVQLLPAGRGCHRRGRGPAGGGGGLQRRLRAG